MNPEPSPTDGFVYNYPTPFDTAVIAGLTTAAVICFLTALVLLVLALYILFNKE